MSGYGWRQIRAWRDSSMLQIKPLQTALECRQVSQEAALARNDLSTRE